MRRYKLKWFKMFVLLFVGYFVYSFCQQQIEISKIRSEIDITKNNMEQINQQNKILLEERNSLSTPAYVEKIAREELGLVKPGEMPYVQTGKK